MAYVNVEGAGGLEGFGQGCLMRLRLLQLRMPLLLLRMPLLHQLSYGPRWAHYLGGYQDQLLGGPLGLSGLCHTAPDGVRRKNYGGEVLR
jgi:hypothetical protein